jgi:hypothetical protein
MLVCDETPRGVSWVVRGLSHLPCYPRFHFMAPSINALSNAKSPHPSPTADNITARILGILVFLAGVALIAYVFWSANTLFHQPPPSVPVAAATKAAAGSAATAPSAAVEIGRSMVDYLKQLLTLFLMCVAGSLIASRGVHMYFSAGRASTQHPAP